MTFKTIGNILNNPKALEIFREHGVDVDHPELCAMQAKIYRERSNKEIQIAGGGAKYIMFDSLCLWESKKKLSASFDNWDPNQQSNLTVARNLKGNAANLSKLMKTHPKKIVLFGPPGTGKTMLALGMMHYLRVNGKTTMFVSSTELIHLFWQSYKYKDAQNRKEKVLDAMQSVDVLVLDDLGTEGGVNSDKPVQKDVQQALEQVATARYDTNNNRVAKSTIVTTNNTPDQLTIIYNGKLISRLLPHSMAYRLDFSGLNDIRE